MDSGVLQAMPNGVLFADWIEQRGISKSTAYKWRGVKLEV